MLIIKKIAALFLLPAIIISIFSGCFFIRDSFSYDFSDPKGYSAGSAEIDALGVEKLDLDWVSGDINIRLQKGSAIRFSETSDSPIKEKHLLLYRYKNGVLNIRYMKPQRNVFNWFGSDIPSKDLDIYIGEDLFETLRLAKINVVSSDVTMEEISLKTLEAATVSGDISLSGKAPSDVDVATVSGRFSVFSDVENIKYSTVSGDLMYESESAPLNLEFASVSANAFVRFDRCAGFKSSLETMSGNARYGFECLINGNTAVYKSSVCNYEFNTVSGNVTIEPL